MAFILSWKNHDDKPDGEKRLETDEELLDYLMSEFSGDIEPQVYDTIEAGYTVYASEDKIEQLEDEEEDLIGGQDTWDGQSLHRWMAEVVDFEFELHQV